MSRTLLRSWLNRPISKNRRQHSAPRRPVAVEELEERQLLASNPLAEPILFDFGTSRSPVAPGAKGITPVVYTATRGYGWQNLSGITGVDRGTGDPLTRDFHRGKNNTFLVNLPNGSYQVTAILGDARSLMDRVNITAEGILVASRLATPANTPLTHTFDVEVKDGRLNLQFQDTGGSNPYFTLAALNIKPSLSQPGLGVNAGPNLTATEGKAVPFSGVVSAQANYSYVWDFGDGTQASDTLTPTHTYQDSGTYTVTLRVTDGDGVEVSDTALVKINNVAPAVTLGGPFQTEANSPVSFAPSVVDPSSVDQEAGFTYLWTFGDGSRSSEANPSHTYTAPGTYQVNLSVTDKDGGKRTVQSTVTVTETTGGGGDLIINAGADKTGKEGQSFNFAGSASGGSSLSYHWDFGDGTFTTNTLTPTHIFQDDGSYTVTLRVTDASGLSAEDSLIVTVDNVAPTVNAGGPYQNRVNTPIAFRANVTDASSVDQAAGFTYLWNFGDDRTNSTSTAANPSHAYSAPGTYTVSLTVTDKDGGRTTVQTTATIDSNTPPPAGLTANAGPDQSVTEGQTVTFSGSATGGLSYLWDFGDGSQATGNLTATHVYRDNGNYTVTLTVTGTNGATAQDTAVVSVGNVAPSVSLGGPYAGRPGAPIGFSPMVSDAGAADSAAGFTYAWNFGDNSTSNQASPSHAYSSLGTYTVTLTVTDKDGATATATTSVTVANPAAPGSFIQTRFDQIPNFGQNPTITAVTSGNWSSGSTWSLGRAPTTGDVVAIGNGKTVTYDVVDDSALKTIVIQSGGHLTFRTDINTRVVATNYLVLEGGRLTIGTTANPVAANVKAEVLIANTPLDLVNDPAQWGNSLIVLGTITTQGAPRSSSFVRLATEPRAGDTTLTLAEAVSGWQAGDRIVLPDSHVLGNNESSVGQQLEFLTIASVSADGRTITLTSPLQHNHLGARDANGHLDFLPHVGNVTRNVLIKSQSATGVRGIVLFTENADINVRETGFVGLGRSRFDIIDNTTFDSTGAVTHVGTAQAGRESVQFRHLTDRGASGTPRFVFEGNSVFCPLQDHNFRWGITVIDSHHGVIRDNMLYNWAGAALEVTADTDGRESRYNTIEKNFSVRVRGSGPSSGWGSFGTGFEFIGGTTNYIRDNVSANSDLLEFNFVGGDGFLEFARNEGYGGVWGFSTWYLNGASTTNPNENAPQSVVKDLHLWHFNQYGVGLGYPSYHITFDGYVARNDSSNPSATAFEYGDYIAKHFVIRNADIQGFRIGIGVPTIQNGVVGVDPNQWFTVENSHLRNYFNIMYSLTGTSGGSGGVIGSKGLVVRNVRFGNLPNTFNDPANPQTNIYLSAGFEGAGWNWIAGNFIYVYDYNGVPGANFRVYYREQAANFILPQSRDAGQTIGSPEAGLTNAENWAKYRIAFSGEVAPANATDGLSRGINGLIAPM